MALQFFAETALMWHSDRGAITLIQRPVFYAQSTFTLEENFFFLFRLKFFTLHLQLEGEKVGAQLHGLTKSNRLQRSDVNC